MHTLSRRDFLKLCGGAAAGSLTSLPLAQPPAPSAPLRTWTVIGLDVPELAVFDATIRDFMQARNIRNGALAVTYRGKLALARGYSWSDDPDDIALPTSLFRVASLSKSITATTILYLSQMGQLQLNQPVLDFIDLKPPPGKTADPRLARVTIRHLLNHLGGWDLNQSFDPMFRDRRIARELDIELPISQQDIMTYMTGQPLDFDPGARYAYSNYGYLLLGRVIESITGRQYADYVKETILAPLGITGMRIGSSLLEDRAPGEVRYYTRSRRLAFSVFDEQTRTPWPYGGWNLANMDSHGGWIASAMDLALFASSFDDPARHPYLIPPTIKTLFAEPPIGINPEGWYYACGWLVRPLDQRGMNVWHDGNLSGTFTLMVRRWDRIDWVVLFNQRDDPSNLPYLDALDPALYMAADAVAHWPVHDLFNRIG
jgi:CubicO group peptidase (beta-lactamase class C family)